MAPKALALGLVPFFALAGCATPPPVTKAPPQQCKSTPCNVTVTETGTWPSNYLDLPDEIQVSTTPITIIWKLSAPSSTYLNPGKPIEFDTDAFKCRIVAGEPDPQRPRSYECTDEAAKGKYKYKVKTKGWWSPPDLDPYVVNN